MKPSPGLEVMSTGAPRPKRWFRVRNFVIVMSLAVVAVIAWFFVEVLRVHSAQPVIAINYRERARQASMSLANINAVDGEASWARLQEALRLAREVTDELASRDPARQPRFMGDDGSVDFELVRQGATLPENIQLERDAIKALRERGFFRRMQELEAMAPGLGPIDSAESIVFGSMSELAQSRSVAKALAASMRLAAASGDLDEAVRNFASGLALARTISLQPTIISALVAIAIEALMLDEGRLLVTEHELTAEQCRAMMTALNQHRRADIHHALESERLTFHDLVQRLFTDDGHGDGYLLPSAFSDIQYVNAPAPLGSAPPSRASLVASTRARFYFAGRRDTLTTFDRFIDGLQVEADLPPGDRWSQGFDVATFRDHLPHSQMLVALLAPALDKALAAFDDSAARRAGTHIMLAIAVFKATHGRLPTTLAELTPEIMPTLPDDPLGATTWGYRLLSNDEHRRQYLLYSWGVDRIDDGGPEPENSWFVSSRGRTAVPDLIVNKPRERLEEADQ